jgi:hypothetical protein
MVQRFAENYESTNQAGSKAKDDLASEAGARAQTVFNSVTSYVRANPTEALVVAAGVAFAIGAIYALPRMQSREERIARDFERRVRQAYQHAQQSADTHTWDRLTDWVRQNLPSRI